MTLMALSLWQPWASAIALGRKSIETRSWATKHRGRLAIHAAKRWTREEREFVVEMGMAGQSFPRGVIVALCTLDTIRATDLPDYPPEGEEARWGNYAPGRAAWHLSNIVALPKPIACVGRQSLWALDPHTEACVLTQVTA